MTRLISRSAEAAATGRRQCRGALSALCRQGRPAGCRATPCLLSALVTVAAQTAEQHPVGLYRGHSWPWAAVYLKYARDKRVFFSLMWESRADIDQRREKAANGSWWLCDSGRSGQRILSGSLAGLQVNASAAGHVPLVAESWYCHPGGESAPRSL